MTVCRTLFVWVIGMALVGVLAAPGFGQTQTGQSAMVTANLSQTDIVITQSTTCTYSVACAKALAAAAGCGTAGQGQWATANKCTLYSGGTTSTTTNCSAVLAVPAFTCWTCVDSGGTATVTLSGSTLGESVTVNPKNVKTSLKYSWSLTDGTGAFRVLDLATTGVGTPGTLMTTDILGKSLGCPAGTFAYVGQNLQATGMAALGALTNGDVCTILAGDSLPGNNQDAADRRDYTQDWTISVSDLSACPSGVCTYTASATIKGVAGLGNATATASACVTVSAENCKNISCP